MSLTTDLLRLQTAKADLKTAINSKGGAITTETIDAYATVVDSFSIQDTTDATAAQDEILATKTAYIAEGIVTGSMVNVGAQTATINTVAGTVTPTQGYHNGAGSVSILAEEQNKILAGNIKDGVIILGVEGTLEAGSDTSDATAIQGEILATKTAYIAAGIVTGSMANNAGNVAAVSSHADGTSIHVVPATGYTDGTDDATVITDADFVAANIKDTVNIFGIAGTYDHEATNPIAVATVLADQVGFVNGTKITGTMANNAGDVAAASYHQTGTSIHIVPATGYTDGSDDATVITDEDFVTGNIKAGVSLFGLSGKAEVVDTTSGTAVADDILATKVGWVNGVEITGSMTNVGAQTGAITTVAGTVAPTQGYHSGAGSISIDADERAKIIAGNIKLDVVILGVTGTHEDATDITDATAVQGEILATKIAYIATGKTTGSMTNVGAQTATITAVADSIVPTEGYHNGAGSVSIAAADQAKLITGNILAGQTILGVAGKSTVVDTYISAVSHPITAAQVLDGYKGFVNGNYRLGTMPDKTGTIQTASAVTSNTTTTRFTIPVAGYYTTSSIIQTAHATLATAIGLTAAKIVTGNTILGIDGTG